MLKGRELAEQITTKGFSNVITYGRAFDFAPEHKEHNPRHTWGTS